MSQIILTNVQESNNKKKSEWLSQTIICQYIVSFLSESNDCSLYNNVFIRRGDQKEQLHKSLWILYFCGTTLSFLTPWQLKDKIIWHIDHFISTLLGTFTTTGRDNCLIERAKVQHVDWQENREHNHVPMVLSSLCRMFHINPPLVFGSNNPHLRAGEHRNYSRKPHSKSHLQFVTMVIMKTPTLEQNLSQQYVMWLFPCVKIRAADNPISLFISYFCF